VHVERRAIHRLVAYPAGPRRVAAAVAEAYLMPYQHFAGPETVSGAPGGAW
jgi:hypothetical protein